MQQELDELLTKAKELLKEETTSISFDTWIKDLEIESINSGNVVLRTPTSFKKDYLDSKYHELLVNTFKFLTNKECSVTIISNEDANNPITQKPNSNIHLILSLLEIITVLLMQLL